MGVDPGLTATGYGVLELAPGGPRVIDIGVITTASTQCLEARLHVLHAAIDALIAARGPGLVVLEDLYTEYRFPRTAVLMGHARGVICLAAGRRGVPVLPLAPAEVKRAVTGSGGAGKGQVQRSVQTLLGLAAPPRSSHVADALALAVTGLGRITTRPLPGRARRP
jgi:crossover junction endodeoxyribonuclease RuvC